MEPKNLENIINTIIGKTFKILEQIYGTHKEGQSCFPVASLSRLVFPHYSNGETRISEQELRFVFVEQFNKYCEEEKLNLYYSVETPTELKYLFKDKSKPRPDEKGQSAMVDLAIHNEKSERIALIEFKALNPDEFCYKKDFCKLTTEWEHNNSLSTFFVMILKSSDSGTEDSIKQKTSSKHPNTQFRCFDLTNGKEIVIK